MNARPASNRLPKRRGVASISHIVVSLQGCLNELDEIEAHVAAAHLSACLDSLADHPSTGHSRTKVE